MDNSLKMGMQDIRVSVALTTYNRPENLRRCLRSLRSQNVQPWEVVVSDNSDTNLAFETERIAKEWSCRYIRAPGSNLYANWNCATLACRGTHIRTMNDDHTFPDGHMEQCLKAAYSDPHSIWTTGEIGFINERYYAKVETAAQLSASGLPEPVKDMDDNWAIASGSTIFPRAVFDRRYRMVEDYDYGSSYLEFGAFLYYHGFRSRCIRGVFVEHHSDELSLKRFDENILESRLYASLCFNLYFRPNLFLASRYISTYIIHSHFSKRMFFSLPRIIRKVKERWSKEQ